MKTICTAISRSARSLTITRFQQSSKVLLPIIEFAQYPRYFSAERPFGSETLEMAPKFELKTPKGTKDCEPLFIFRTTLIPVV
jgi:hypothetical protein